METICAISTAYGTGGIAVIRVSGDNAVRIVDKLFNGRRHLSEASGGTVHYGRLEKDDECLDEVLCTVFRAPHSFTGEDVVEISCHGSIFIQQEILRWLMDAGCRAAQPGEFTRRAFVNGKMDLTQAEAVADLIAAQSKAEKDLALSQLRGAISNELTILRERLLHFTSLVELELDFADHEELEFANRKQLQTLAEEIANKLSALLTSFRTGNAIRNGIPVAIIGAPNVGKSTLLNALLGEQRAIVSSVQGTTRDTVEDSIILDGILFRLIDTAGLHETEDVIENMGIERSLDAARKAQIIIHVMDASNPVNMPPINSEATVIHVYNKTDLATANGMQICAKNGQIEPLKRELISLTRASMQTNTVMLSNARHYDAIKRAYDAIKRVMDGIEENLSGELLSIDLQDCLNAIGEVTGQITNAEVLSTIFSKFCIGK